MASIRQSIRSSTSSKRPTSAIADGQIALNTASGTPGLFFKDNAGNIIKTGPAHYGASAPNSSPAVGGSTGNSIGEAWLDSSLTPAGWKVWNGAAWVNATPVSSDTVQGLVELATNVETQAGIDTARAVTSAGLQSKVSDSISTTSASGIASSTAVKTAYDLANAALPKSGGIITGNLEIGSTGSLTFEGSTADAFETALAVVNPTTDRTITLPDTTGTIITTGDTGTVTSTMLLDGTIVNADISDTAAIAGTKISPNFGSQNITTSGNIAASGNITATRYIAPSGTAIAPSVQVGSGVFYPPGIYSPGVDQLAITTSGVTRLLADANGCITVSPSSGSTKSVWAGTGDISSGTTFSNIGFHCQPPTIYNGIAAAFSGDALSNSYYPALFSSALTSNIANIDGFNSPILYGLSVYATTTATASGAGVRAVGIGNTVARGSSDNVASGSLSGLMIGIQNQVTMGSGVSPGSTLSSMTGMNSNASFQAGTTTGTIASYASGLYIAIASGTTSNATNCYSYNTFAFVGATSGAGTGVVTTLANYRAKLTVNATGQVTNYYGVLLATPTVNGTLTNRYSVYSEDASSPMYHAGSIGVGTPTPAYQLQLSTDSAGKPSTNTWTVVSDERIKDDIELANLDLCYEAVKNIPLKRFKWKDEVYSSEQVNDRRKLGWIAQDVEVVFPKAVRIKEFKYNQTFEDVIVPAVEPELDDEGNVIAQGEPERIKQKLISEDVIEDCRDLNVDQLYAAMYGTIQKLISKVETLEATVAILEDDAT
jgi:hypothetical protein